MHSFIIRMTTLGPNLKGKLKFTCIIRTHAFTLQRSDHKQVLDFVSLSVITRHGATMAAAVATDAHRCRGDTCGRKHLHFHQLFTSAGVCRGSVSSLTIGGVGSSLTTVRNLTQGSVHVNRRH